MCAQYFCIVVGAFSANNVRMCTAHVFVAADTYLLHFAVCSTCTKGATSVGGSCSCRRVNQLEPLPGNSSSQMQRLFTQFSGPIRLRQQSRQLLEIEAPLVAARTPLAIILLVQYKCTED